MFGRRIHVGALLRRTICLSLVCCLTNTQFVLASDQTAGGTISGTVLDATGAAVVGARITVINDAAGIQRQTITSEEGRFEVLFLLSGSYTMTIEMPGFSTVRVIEINLQSGINFTVPVTLQPRGSAETITVKARNSQVDLADATVKYTITRNQVTNLPLIASVAGRSILSTFPLYVPGITPGLQLGIRGEGLVVNGARPLSNSFYIDGGDDNDYDQNVAAAPFPNPDALQEIVVVTNNYKADLGGATGGVFDAVVRSGGPRLHGNVRYFISNEALDARSFFDPVRRIDRLNTFGGQLGGPLVIPRIYEGKGKTTFFADFETNRVASQGLEQFPVLTDDQRNGDFSGLLPFNPTKPNRTPRPIDPLTGQSFPGGKIPSDRIDPLAKLYIDRFIPRANLDGDIFRGLLSGSERNDQLTSRLDHKISESNEIAATFFYNNLVSQGTSAVPPGTGTAYRQNFALVVRETHAFSERAVNQITGTFSRYVNQLALSAQGFTGVSPATVGFRIVPQSSRFLALPDVSLPNLVSVSAVGGAQESSKTTAAVKDDFRRTAGGHTLGIGGGLRWFSFDNVFPNDNGSFDFQNNQGPGYTQNGLADFLLGLPAGYEQNAGEKQEIRQQGALSLYVMDDWKVRPNLTLNVGLRYEMTPPSIDALNQAAAFRPGSLSRVQPAAPAGVLFPGDADPVLGGIVPKGGYRAYMAGLAPRFGVAYSPKPASGILRRFAGDGRTAIRAGFGVFFDPSFGAILQDVARPFGAGVSLLNPNSSLGLGQPVVGTFSNPFGNQQNPFPISRSQFTPFPTSGLFVFNAHYRPAYTYQYNLTVQRELPGAMLFEMAYVGSDSFRTTRQRDLNSAFVDPSTGFSTSPFPGLGSIIQTESSGRARYDSLQVHLSRRFGRNLSINAWYVLEKSLDNSSGPVNPLLTSFLTFPGYPGSNSAPGITDPFQWARSSFDISQNFVATYTYDFPASSRRGLLGLIANGWRLGGVTQLRTGSPMDINQFGFGFPGGPQTPDFNGHFQRFDPRQVRTFVIDGLRVAGNYFFDPTAFSFTNNSPGTLGRNAFSGPGINLTSLAIAKRFVIAESNQLELRADISNLFNHANFIAPDAFVPSPTTPGVVGLPAPQLGKVFSALPGRTIQLSARFRF